MHVLVFLRLLAAQFVGHGLGEDGETVKTDMVFHQMVAHIIVVRQRFVNGIDTGVHNSLHIGQFAVTYNVTTGLVRIASNLQACSSTSVIQDGETVQVDTV